MCGRRETRESRPSPLRWSIRSRPICSDAHPRRGHGVRDRDNGVPGKWPVRAGRRDAREEAEGSAAWPQCDDRAAAASGAIMPVGPSGRCGQAQPDSSTAESGRSAPLRPTPRRSDQRKLHDGFRAAWLARRRAGRMRRSEPARPHPGRQPDCAAGPDAGCTARGKLRHPESGMGLRSHFPARRKRSRQAAWTSPSSLPSLPPCSS